MPHAPTKYAVALYPGFQALDVFGSLDILNIMGESMPALELSVLGPTLDPVSTLCKASPGRVGQSVVPTHTYNDAPSDIEVLIVPGGIGARSVEDTRVVVEYIQRAYPTLRYFLTVCTGSAIAARAGVLDGKMATSNKKSFSWVVTQGPSVEWIKEARWVVDGNVWTSSGISAGMDMMYGFVEEQYGSDVAEGVSRGAEYVRSRDPLVDPFAQYAG